MRYPVKIHAAKWLILLMAAIAAFSAHSLRAASDFETHTLRFADSTVTVHIERGDKGVTDDAILAWVERAGEAVTSYYGRFPVGHTDIAVGVARSGGIGGGKAYGAGQIAIELGPETSEPELLDDWRLTHEMVHLAFPYLDRRHAWLTEGVATYVEPIARARAGQMPAETVWRWLVTGLPKGLPADGDRGLDRTHTWGRTYWGGALYCFLADMKIRRETGNRKSLDDALRAILESGGHGDASWSIERVIDIGDRATGTTVMRDLYEAMAETPVTPDIEQWFRRLGVRYEEGEVRFNETAPLVDIRRAVTDRGA